MNNTKAWYLSKTLWVNTIAVLALLLQSHIGFVISPESQAGLLAVVNLILRVITGSAINWATPAADDIPPGPPATAGFIRLPLLPVIMLAMLCALASLSGCATTTSTGTATGSAVDTINKNDSPQILAGKSLLAVKSTIVSAAQAIDALCKAGTIDTDTCRRAHDAYQLAKPAYDSAVESYLLMMSGLGDPAAFAAALQRSQSLAANLLSLAGGVK